MKTWFALSLILLFTPCPAGADENALFTKDYARRVGQDVSAIPAAMGHWMAHHWLLTGGVVGLAVVAGSMDGETREDFGSRQTNGRHDRFSRAVKPFGDYRYLAPLIAGAWIGGMASGSGLLSKIAADGLEANLVAGALITPSFNFIAGRNRPYAEASSLDFEPFHAGRTSFPSGHTTAAFAMAAVIDANLRSRYGYWQTPVVYSVASAVGVSRVYDQKHHPSDVAMGAVVGMATGYWISHRPRNKDSDLSVDVGLSDARVNYKF